MKTKPRPIGQLVVERLLSVKEGFLSGMGVLFRDYYFTLGTSA